MIPISKQIMYKTKWRRLFAPTQLSIQGQWLHFQVRTLMTRNNRAHGTDLLVMLCNAARTAFAVLASQRLANHAKYTKVLLVKLPLLKQLVYHDFLLVSTTCLRNKAGVFCHRVDVEICCEAIEHREQYIQNWRRGIGC